jgi:molybdopterin-guanine dinucleotide biosynthesis protein A
MRVAGLLLTGGASRRLGVTKATLTVSGEHLATRAVRVLDPVCQPVLEVGPGYSTVDAVQEVPPGAGPLAAVAAGWAALTEGGHRGPTIVLAVDLPFVTTEVIGWLATHPSRLSVVPRVGGREQSLCARYAPDALDAAQRLVELGERSMRALLADVEVHFAHEDEWQAIAPPGVFADVDTREDAATAGIEVAGSLDPRE